MASEAFGPYRGLQTQGLLLIVDDDPLTAQRLASILQAEGYQTETAHSGTAALSALTRFQPSLILLDYVMPGLDGAATLRILKSQVPTRSIPVAILTSYTGEQHVAQAMNAGADDFIDKSTNPRVLVARVRSLLLARLGGSEAAESQRLRRDLEQAERVQQAQLPQGTIRSGGWAATGSLIPGGQVAGDVFDIVEASDGRLICIVVDVSGHGVAAALVAAELRMELRTLVQSDELVEAFPRLNERLAKRGVERYACVGAIELRDTAVRAVNAGLPPIVHISETQVRHQVVASGCPLGLFSSASYVVSEFEVHTGDTLVIVSDGLTEPFGDADDLSPVLELLAPVAPGLNLLSEGTSQHLNALLEQTALDTRDDATLVVAVRE